MTKIDVVNAISPDLLEKASVLQKQLAKMESDIIDRCNYIMTSIFKLFDKKSAYWYFYGAGEGEFGDFWDNYHKDYVHIIADNCPGKEMVILLKDGSEWGFSDGFPTRWLFEDFENELIEGKSLYEKREAERQEASKKKREEKKIKVKAIAEIAKSKLSKEELAALKKVL